MEIHYEAITAKMSFCLLFQKFPKLYFLLLFIFRRICRCGQIRSNSSEVKVPFFRSLLQWRQQNSVSEQCGACMRGNVLRSRVGHAGGTRGHDRDWGLIPGSDGGELILPVFAVGKPVRDHVVGAAWATSRFRCLHRGRSDLAGSSLSLLL